MNLILPIVIPVGGHRILPTQLGRHGLRRLSPGNPRNGLRRIRVEPEEMLLAGVGPAGKAVAELRAEGHPEITQPHILKKPGTSPKGGGVLHIPDRHVAGLSGKTRRSAGEVGRYHQDPVRRVEELCGL